MNFISWKVRSKSNLNVICLQTWRQGKRVGFKVKIVQKAECWKRSEFVTFSNCVTWRMPVSTETLSSSHLLRLVITSKMTSTVKRVELFDESVTQCDKVEEKLSKVIGGVQNPEKRVRSFWMLPYASVSNKAILIAHFLLLISALSFFVHFCLQ